VQRGASFHCGSTMHARMEMESKSMIIIRGHIAAVNSFGKGFLSKDSTHEKGYAGHAFWGGPSVHLATGDHEYSARLRCQ